LNYFQEAKAHFIVCHQHPVNQALHHLVNLMAIAALISLPFDWRMSVFLVVFCQIIAHSGHVFIEKNRPATVKYPGMSILASLSWSFDHWFGLRPVEKESREEGMKDEG
jgi:hypothetical protein